MRVGRGDAERLRGSRPPPHPPQCAHWGTFPPVGGRLGARSNREEFGPLWDVWIHILGIGAECACWKAGGHMGPPLRRIRKPSLLFRRGRTLAGPWFRATIRAAPTREGAGTCPLIRPLRGHLTLSPLAFGHIPLIRGVGPKGGRHDGRVGTPAPTAGFGQKQRAHNVRPYKRGCGKLPPHPPQWEACGGWAEIWSNFLLCHFLRYFFQKFRESRGKHKIFLKTGCVHPGIFLHLQIRFLSNFVL